MEHKYIVTKSVETNVGPDVVEMVFNIQVTLDDNKNLIDVIPKYWAVFGVHEGTGFTKQIQGNENDDMPGYMFLEYLTIVEQIEQEIEG